MAFRTVALVLALALACTSVEAAPRRDDAAKLAVAHRMVAAWNGRDWRAAADLFTEDGVLRSMMIEPVVGREVIYRRFAELGSGIEAIKLDVSHMGVIDGLVFMERVDRFTYRGKQGATPVVGVLAFRDGKISEWREYYDRNQLLTEMGLANPPAAKP